MATFSKSHAKFNELFLRNGCYATKIHMYYWLGLVGIKPLETLNFSFQRLHPIELRYTLYLIEKQLKWTDRIDSRKHRVKGIQNFLLQHIKSMENNCRTFRSPPSTYSKQYLNIKSFGSVVRTKLGRSLSLISLIPGIQSTTLSK